MALLLWGGVQMEVEIGYPRNGEILCCPHHEVRVRQEFTDLAQGKALQVPCVHGIVYGGAGINVRFAIDDIEDKRARLSQGSMCGMESSEDVVVRAQGTHGVEAEHEVVLLGHGQVSHIGTEKLDVKTERAALLTSFVQFPVEPIHP